MKNKTAYILGILLTILIGSYFNSTYCCQDDPVTEADVAQPLIIEPTKNVFNIFDSVNDFSVNDMDNYNFKLSSSSILMPLSANVTKGVTAVSEYITLHPERAINITGHYKSDEVNNSAFPNLGLARANAIKNHFVTNGVPSRHINTFGVLDDDFVSDGDSILYGPVSFETVGLSSQEALLEEMDAIAAEIKGKPLILNFKTGAATLTLTPEQRIKVAKIARYLDKVDTSTCRIVGHTDDTGTPEGNLVLGQQRADFAKDYLVRNHIRDSKVTSLSKGQNEPITSNDTPEGRSQNRRIEVTIN
jgi:outer membrane protein OmpA-like peptidoglycan-associated protein